MLYPKILIKKLQKKKRTHITQARPTPTFAYAQIYFEAQFLNISKQKSIEYLRTINILYIYYSVLEFQICIHKRAE